MSVAADSHGAGRKQGRGRGLLWASAGLFGWVSCLVLLYAGLSIACRTGSAVAIGEPVWRGLLVATWAAHALLIAWLAMSVLRSKRAERAPATPAIDTIEARDVGPRADHDAGFVSRLALLLNGVALLATLWIGFPVLVLPLCL